MLWRSSVDIHKTSLFQKFVYSDFVFVSYAQLVSYYMLEKPLLGSHYVVIYDSNMHKSTIRQLFCKNELAWNILHKHYVPKGFLFLSTMPLVCRVVCLDYCPLFWPTTSGVTLKWCISCLKVSFLLSWFSSKAKLQWAYCHLCTNKLQCSTAKIKLF